MSSLRAELGLRHSSPTHSPVPDSTCKLSKYWTSERIPSKHFIHIRRINEWGKSRCSSLKALWTAAVKGSPLFSLVPARILEFYFARLGNFPKGGKSIFPTQSTFGSRSQRERPAGAEPLTSSQPSLLPPPSPHPSTFDNSVGNQFAVNHKGVLFTLLKELKSSHFY